MKAHPLHLLTAAELATLALAHEGGKDLRGELYGCLRMVGWAGPSLGASSESRWVAVCVRERAHGQCGGLVIVRGSKLRNGHTRSCGCLRVDGAAKARRIVELRRAAERAKLAKVVAVVVLNRRGSEVMS